MKKGRKTGGFQGRRSPLNVMAWLDPAINVSKQKESRGFPPQGRA